MVGFICILVSEKDDPTQIITHFRAADTTSGAADEPHFARDVTC